MGESVMFAWFEKVLQTYIKEKQKELDFDRSFMVCNAFKRDKTDNVKVSLATNTAYLALVPVGYTCKCKPLDVCKKKPLKDVTYFLRRLCHVYCY